jgi:hypothetical protein
MSQISIYIRTQLISYETFLTFKPKIGHLNRPRPRPHPQNRKRFKSIEDEHEHEYEDEYEAKAEHI